jgi:hypothetical protein
MSEPIFSKTFTAEENQPVKIEITAGGRLILWVNNFGVIEAKNTIFGGQMLVRDLDAIRYALELAQSAIGDHIADKMQAGEMK